MQTALIELSSNSFRLTVSDGIHNVLQRNHHLGLAASVSVNGAFTQPDIDQATFVAKELAFVAENFGYDQIMVVATEAFRLASNGEKVAEHISLSTGHEVRILSEVEETGLAWEAISSEFPAHPNIAMADLGGGSLGLAFGPTNLNRPQQQSSHRLGVSLLSPRTLKNGVLSSDTRIRLEHHIASELRPAIQKSKNQLPLPTVLVGGAARGIAQLIYVSRRAEMPETEHGFVIDCSDLGHLINRLSKFPLASRLAMPGMKERRAEAMPLAATILRQLLRSLEVHEAVVSTSGLREGILQRLTVVRKAA